MKTLFRRLALGVLLIAATTSANAATREDLESSAVVEGSIVVAKDGSVQDVTIDQPAKYGQPIADFVRQAALKWRFQPVLIDGAPVVAKSAMHARVVLKKKADGRYNVRLKGATFGSYDSNDTGELRDTEGGKQFRPKYPAMAILMRVQGTVYLSLQVDRSGRVVQAVAEQVNLRNTGPESVMQRARAALADSAVSAARHWKYAVPTTGKLAAQDSWTVHTSVNYELQAFGEQPHESIWQTYIPGPYTPAPWVDKPDADAADALADDGMQTDGAGPVLLTPVGHG